MNPIIELNDVTKQFVVNRRQYGFKSMLLHFPQYFRDMASPQYFTALDHISFSVMPGETIGIVGPNGSGKTTLLSLIGGVLKRYSGSVMVRGRISMMLALGSGFCSELSGRENVILNGVLQGRTKQEMKKLLDEIVDFSGIGDFIDSPIYQYSSGMQMRLGFAIATSVEPEILLIDEVMAVGDAEFTKKCAERMGKLLAGGTTLLLTSHSDENIKKYCKRVIHLQHGEKLFDGPQEVFYAQSQL